MSDGSDLLDEVNRITSLSVEEFATFLKSVNADGACGSCGRNVDWLIRRSDDKPVLLQAPFYSLTDEADVFFSTLCPLCGNTRFYNARYVAKYLAQKRSPGNGE
ncbi:hypothetical protein SAMN05216593_1017 [Pseudomonas asturiensis]|uniref:Uncharacterized protein n=1 Tax=Pseudomonas asturiensis TaxID=1190415 RepID=A0A1M7IYW4_9PSED|nr:hypothetical protein SAMN05216593_1017 [Pseudomonas asturiensis]